MEAYLDTTKSLDTLIVGAGFAGMYSLHKQLSDGFKAEIYEQADDVGGTWYWNRYPGARCDIESMDYSYSFSEELQQEWNWKEKYGTQPELLKYAQYVCEKFKLRNKINFNTKITKANFSEKYQNWFIETDKNLFDDSTATFMDFTVDQKRNTRFMYVLPISPNKALFEYTLFSKEVLTKDEYEGELLKYLDTKFITEYTITEIEQGVIPMTSYKFWVQNSKNILHIGTVGGWTKASTGYTFKNTSKKTIQLIAFLKAENDFTHFRKKTRFWWYDLLLIDVLSSYNHLGSKLFSTLFKRNSLKNVFRFLDEETSFIEDLRIMLSMPPLRFIVALFRRVLNF